MALEKEMATFEKHREELLAHEGKYVLIHQEEVAGYWETYEDALQAGYEKYALKPFLVKKIQSVEDVQFFSRDIPVCQS